MSRFMKACPHCDEKFAMQSSLNAHMRECRYGNYWAAHLTAEQLRAAMRLMVASCETPQERQAARIAELEATCRRVLDNLEKLRGARLPGNIAGAMVDAREALKNAIGA